MNRLEFRSENWFCRSNFAHPTNRDRILHLALTSRCGQRDVDPDYSSHSQLATRRAADKCRTAQGGPSDRDRIPRRWCCRKHSAEKTGQPCKSVGPTYRLKFRLMASTQNSTSPSTRQLNRAKKRQILAD